MAYGSRNRQQPQNVEPLVTITPTKWQDQPVPPRRWLVDGILTRGSITLLTSDGGAGKSLLLQQLQTAIALGGDWLGIGLPDDPVSSFGLYCEEDEDELHRRQADINRGYDIDMHTIGGLVHFTSRVGEDNILATFGYNDRIEPSGFYAQITHKIRETCAQLVIVDTAADTFGGNENYRAQVRSFINLLRRWAMESDGGVILTAHPSNFGISQGTGISGSTAWNNSVRARIYLTKPKDDAEEYGEKEETNERILKVMKNNYGPSGNQIRLRWEHGIYAPVNRGGSDMVDRIALDNAVLSEIANLMADGVKVLAAENSPRAYLKLLRNLPAFKRSEAGEIRAAKDRLLAKDRIVRVEIGPASKREVLIRPADLRYPGEDE